MLYYIDKQHIVRVKDIKPDNVLKAFHALVRSIVNNAQAADSAEPPAENGNGQPKSE